MIIIFKKRSVWFWFYKLETEKTEPNPNNKKIVSNRKKNRVKPEKSSETKKTGFCSKITELNQNWSI